MRSSSPPVVERARPLLGTYVAVRAGGLPPTDAQRAVDAAFRRVALIHRLMSFHDPASDVSRLNRDAARAPVAVDAHTLAVLRRAREIAEASGGAFDVTVAPALVRWGLRPAPAGARPPDPRGSWRDVELGADGRVRFHRPVWLDLGGIAKGYAVDEAIACLRAHGATRACVNAGGDLRVLGPAPERVRLRPPSPTRDVVAVVDLENGSLASSSGHRARRCVCGSFRGPHVDPARRRAVDTHAFACVLAEDCVVADALTKVVLVRGRAAAGVLCRYGATAWTHAPRRGWRRLGE